MHRVPSPVWSRLLNVRADQVRRSHDKRTLDAVHDLTSCHGITYDVLYAVMLSGATLS